MDNSSLHRPRFRYILVGLTGLLFGLLQILYAFLTKDTSLRPIVISGLGFLVAGITLFLTGVDNSTRSDSRSMNWFSFFVTALGMGIAYYMVYMI